MTLEFKVTGQHISWLNNTEHVVADSRNYLKAKFTFSEEWTYPVTVLFKGRCKTVPVLLAQAGEEITVPPEVLKGPLMLVSCYCGDLITADSARVKIDPSGYTESPEPSDPEASSYYSQMIAYIDQINALIGEDAEARDTLTKLQDVIDKAQSATALPDQTVIGQMDALIDQYIANEDAVANQILDRSIEYLKTGVRSLGYQALCNAKSLRKIVLPEAVELGTNCLSECVELVEVQAPRATDVKERAFNACAKLMRLRLDSALYIGVAAFANLTNAERIDLPSAQYVSSTTFWSSTKLSALILRRTDGICIASGNPLNTSVPIYKGTGYIYVPRALIDDYKTATNWAVYAAQFRAIEDYPDICAPEEWED